MRLRNACLLSTMLCNGPGSHSHESSRIFRYQFAKQLTNRLVDNHEHRLLLVDNASCYRQSCLYRDFDAPVPFLPHHSVQVSHHLTSHVIYLQLLPFVASVRLFAGYLTNRNGRTAHKYDHVTTVLSGRFFRIYSVVFLENVTCMS